jgi:hypothetical protein
MEEITVYKANFVIKCWHEFCGRCDWRENKKCLLFDQNLKEENYNAFGEGYEILRCKTCKTFCDNMPREDFGEGEYVGEE